MVKAWHVVSVLPEQFCVMNCAAVQGVHARHVVSWVTWQGVTRMVTPGTHDEQLPQTVSVWLQAATWNVDPATQEEHPLQTVLLVAVQACSWKFPEVFEQFKQLAQMRSEVAVASRTWYWFCVHTVVFEHTRSEVGVSGVLSNWNDVHCEAREQVRSVVAVAGTDSKYCG